MRIGFDARLALYDAAGVGGYIRRLAPALTRELGADTFRPLVDFRDAGWPSEARRVLGPAHSRLGDFLVAVQAKIMGLDLLHCPDHVLPPVLGMPAVLTVHDVSFWALPETHSQSSRAYYARCAESVGRAGAVICDSDHGRDELLRYVQADPDKVVAIPLGLTSGFGPVDPKTVRRTAAGYGLEGRYVLYVGALAARKNLPRLIQAFLGAHTSPDVMLALAGSPGYGSEDVFRALAQPAAAGRVKLLGAPPMSDMPALMAGAEFLALVSLYEGFGLPALEAMACGVPCLISDMRPLTDLVGDAGLAVNPLDVDSMAAGTERLLGEPDLRSRLSRAGPARAAAYTWERTAQQTAAVYRRVLT